MKNKKKVAILTINDDNNYGNRLQNYALQKALQKLGVAAETVKNIKTRKRQIKFNIKDIIIKLIEFGRRLKFKKFNSKYIVNSKFIIKDTVVPKELSDYYDYFIVGSDQVWNYTYDRFSNIDLLSFTTDNKRISYAASFGVSELEDNVKELFENNLKRFKAISVREIKGKEIIENLIKRKDLEVVLDPTLLLTKEEWKNISIRPKYREYLLTYFLGEMPDDIKNIANKYNLKIINLLKIKEINNFISGPNGFIGLIEKAKIVCTDSYHAVIFSIIFDRPFIVYDRKSLHKSMNSRLDTLLKLCHLESRKYENIREIDILKNDYSNAYSILEKEREKSILFLKKALEIQN